MVTIAKRSNIIPVDFGEFVLEYKANDANIKRLDEIGSFLKERGENLKDKDSQDVIENLKQSVAEGWTEVFGEGAFEKVYAFAEESTIDSLVYLIEAIKGIMKEFEVRNSKDALSKYLDD